MCGGQAGGAGTWPLQTPGGSQEPLATFTLVCSAWRRLLRAFEGSASSSPGPPTTQEEPQAQLIGDRCWRLGHGGCGAGGQANLGRCLLIPTALRAPEAPIVASGVGGAGD